MERDDLIPHGLDAGLSRERAEALAAAARFGVTLKDAGSGDELSGCRFGGLPALSADFAWPAWRERPLSFLAQIRLEDVGALDDEKILPQRGLLLFFWDSGAVALYAGDAQVEDEAGWGFDPADAGSAQVLFMPDDSSVEIRRPPPGLYGGAILPARKMTASRRLTIPAWGSTDFDELGLREEEIDTYLTFREELDRRQQVGDEWAPRHQLLGHPDQVQGDMQHECQLVTHGLYCGDASGYVDPRAAELRSGANEWRLLLQLGSDEEGLRVSWGDLGRLYYWIREADLRATRFDATWLILQCG